MITIENRFEVNHPDNCGQPFHLGYVLGVYDSCGMRVSSREAVNCGPNVVTVDEIAEAAALSWPGSQVCVWLDLSLRPTEHLRDTPEPDAKAGPQ